MHSTLAPFPCYIYEYFHNENSESCHWQSQQIKQLLNYTFIIIRFCFAKKKPTGKLRVNCRLSQMFDVELT